MKLASKEYEEDNASDDHLADFILTRGTKFTDYQAKNDGGVVREKATERDFMRKEYQEWKSANKRYEPQENNTKFSRRMTKLGYSNQKSGSQTWFVGLKILTEYEKSYKEREEVENIIDDDDLTELENVLVSNETISTQSVITDEETDEETDAFDWIKRPEIGKWIRFPKENRIEGHIFKLIGENGKGKEPIGDYKNGKPYYYKK